MFVRFLRQRRTAKIMSELSDIFTLKPRRSHGVLEKMQNAEVSTVRPPPTLKHCGGIASKRRGEILERQGSTFRLDMLITNAVV